MNPLTGRQWWLACLLVLLAALAALVPTTGDFGLTYDEPNYRHCQLVSADWWQRLGQARTRTDLDALLAPDALAFYWPYARHGINFHPPLAGQLNLLTYRIFGSWMKDYPARRMATVIEFALTVTLLFGFLARRYGPWVGVVAAASLLVMPRLYGQAHLAETDTSGLLLWAATALVFWKGLHDPKDGGARVAVGVLLGLAFVEKMGVVFVVGPLWLWLAAARLPATLRRSGGRDDWIDGLVTTTALLAPLGWAFAEVLRLTHKLPPPKTYSPFLHRPESPVPGVILTVPLVVWCVRRLIARRFRGHRIWGVERPALETWAAILAFAPVVGWLGNPGWWRETMPRLAHYYMLNFGRRGSLPDIQVIYFGQVYEYSLPWHNAWVLIAITVPAGILAAAVAGLIFALFRVHRDRLPLYFLVHLVTLPLLRMLPTPAHDGVRLFLPTFFFLAAFAGWGVVWVADGLARLVRGPGAWFRAALSALVLVPAAWQLIKIHPYELSYYNEWVGGPKGAWNAGFELSYWYDAFNGRTLAEINDRLPQGASVTFPNGMSAPIMVLQDLQALGHLRADLRFGVEPRGGFPFMWFLTHDSKADAFTRLLFVMTPRYESRPRQLDKLRVAAVFDPVASSRAWALQLLADAGDDRPDSPAAPAWVRDQVPILARFWGDGVTKFRRPAVHEPIFAWAENDPDGLRAGARLLAAKDPPGDHPGARALRDELMRYPERYHFLMERRPEALVEAVEVLIARPDAVRRVLLRYPYIDPAALGGPLDGALPKG